MKNNKLSIIFAFFTLSIILSACAPGSGAATVDDPAGFFMGIWHGWIAPISLVWGFFNPEIRIYEVYNIGWSYDVGYYIAIIGGFGGFSLIRRKKKDRD